VQPRHVALAHPRRQQRRLALAHPPPRAQRADVEGRRGQGHRQGGVVQLRLVGGHGHGGERVEADGGHGGGRFLAAVGEAGQGGGRLRALGPHQGGLAAHLPAQGGDGQGRGVGAQHHQAQRRLIEAAERPLPGLRRLVGWGAATAQPVRRPARRDAPALQVQQGQSRGVVRGDALQQDLDARAAQQADVGPGAALAIDQPPRLAVGQAGAGVAGDVAFQASAGQEAGRAGGGQHHLRAHRPRPTLVQADDGGQGRRLAGLQRRPQRRAGVVGEAEQRPFG